MQKKEIPFVFEMLKNSIFPLFSLSKILQNKIINVTTDENK